MAEPKSDVSEATESSVAVPSPIEAQVALPKVKASFLGFYKYATKIDILLVLIGVFFAIVEGVALPMFTLVAGSLTNNFNTALVGGGSADEFKHNVNHNSLYFVYIGIGIFGAASISAALLANRGEVLASRFRKIYLQKTLGQNIAYFDKLGSGEVTTRITNSTTGIQEAISEKIGTICSGIACFVTALVIAFVTQWKLSCILLSGVFFIILDMIVGSGIMIKYVKLSDGAYSQGSSIVEESISAIRTGVAFGIQNQLSEKFDVYLKKSVRFNHTKNYFLSGMLGTLWGSIFWIYALSFWEGSRILVDGDTKIGDIFVVISCMLIGAFQFGNIGPEAQFIVKGLAGLADINETIERTPVIDSNAPGIVPESVEGNITFQNVEFRYPSRPDVLVLPNFSLEIKSGQTVALVGSSGCGKSTCIGILERFYKILGGQVLLDGHNIEDLQVKWLRQQLGLVSQEPTLFGVTIYENIAFGLVGTQYENVDEEKKREMVISACKQANAFDFIQTLTDGLDTNVGDRGFLLSGGQKQRIAIARAIVSDPKILLLDEATSALDTKSEGIVQEALDRAAKSRTTIVIAHRLSTIRNANKIVVMAQGEIIEQGTHHELIANKKNYYDLVMAQNLSQDSSDSEGEGDEQPEQLIQEDEPALLRRGTSMSSKSQSSYKDATSLKKPGLLTVLRMLWRLNDGEHKWIIGGAIFTILLGYGYPAMAILVGKTISAMIVDPSQYDHMRSRVNLYSGMLFMVGVEQLITATTMTLCFTIASEALVRKVRLNMFKQFMRMDMSYFDDAAHTPGSLTSIIGKDGKAIEGLGGSTLGQILQSLVIVIGGVAQSIGFSWRIGLVATACVPIMLSAGFGRVYILNRLNERTSRTYEGSGSLASSYASAVRTVQSLTLEDRLCSVYNSKIDHQVRDSLVPHISSGLAFGFTQALTPWVMALIFWYGSNQLVAGHVSVSSFFVVFIGSIMGSQAAGSVFSYAPNMGKAKEASVNVYNVINATPTIDYTSEDGIKLSSDEVIGNIEFKDVHFHYPTRPQVPVLRGLNLSVKKGEFIALVGPSGCGKSTCIQLIEHFYNTHKGSVLIDGHDIAQMNVSNLRSHISLVQQEPLLFSGTVRENILYGWSSEDTSEVSDEYLYTICKNANIHDFVMGLPDGYDTDIGAHGGLLSGGQKQRIAIARALLRDPKILLLDEATSALDSQSEKIVQATLDEAAKGRTTIAVAHRLSTIQHADRIFVFDRGRVIESGTHEELLKLKGSYAELVRLQDLEQ